MKIVKFIKNSFIDYPRHIATVAFTHGCNWSCWYCQNADLLHENADLTQEFFEFLSTRKGLVDGVVICGGEPTIHADLPQTIRKIKEMGFDVKLDTNGTNPEMLAELIGNNLVDYIAMDIKAPISKLSQITLSRNKIERVAESIELIKNSGVEYEFRTTVTPDLTENDIEEMAKSIAGAKKYILQQYNKPKLLANAPEPHKIETVKHFVSVAQKWVPACELR